MELDLDLDSEHNDDDLESYSLLSDSVGIELALKRISVVPNFSRTGPKLENTNLLHYSSAVEFFQTFYN